MNSTQDLPLKTTTAKRSPLPPGPKGHPILGVMPEFNRDILGFILKCREYGDVMVDDAERIAAKRGDGELRDIQRDMMRLTLEIVVKTLFDSDVSGDADNVGNILSGLLNPFASQATLKWILDNRLPTPEHRRFHKAVGEIDKIVYRIVGERRASGYDQGDLLSMLLQAHDDDGSQMTDAQLRDEVITLFLAGHETTALVLMWSWYLISKNPEAE